MSDQVLAACAEFPNDNPGLHRGAIWYGGALSGPPVCDLPPAPLDALAEVALDAAEAAIEPVVEPPTDPTPPVTEADEETDDIEIVEDMVFDDVLDESPIPPEVPALELEPVGEAPMTLVDSVPPPAPELPTEAVILESVPPAAPESSVEPVTDPFAMLVAVLEDVARASGAGDAAMTTLLCVLGRTRLDASAPAGTDVLRAQALAWQGILRGESEDFAACGSGMLDEWCAAVVAGVLGQPMRADGLKRELRRRGVAAFGIVEQAA